MVVNTRLTLVFQTGTAMDGKPEYRSKNFNNIKETATDVQLKTVADALAPLQQFPVVKVERFNTHLLV